jgi:hypothetical protein
VENVVLASGQSTQITDPTNDLPFSNGGSVTADNQTIAYIAHRSFDDAIPNEVVLVDRDGSNPRSVWQGQLGSVVVAPDGSQLAVSVFSGPATTYPRDQSIWIIGSDGGNPHQIANGSLPAWRPGGGNASTASVQAPAATAVPATPDTSEGGPAASTPSVPDTLTDPVRADILAAVDRANSAWTAASQSLDPSGLTNNVAGQELIDDTAELDRLRAQGQSRKNVNTAFSVTDTSVDAPGHAIVHTHETWYAQISDAASGRLVQRTPSATYDETYVLEYQSSGWIVVKNDLS